MRENGHTTNPFGLVTRLVEQFRRDGGEIVRARASGFRLDGGRLTAIQTDTGDLPADAAIVAPAPTRNRWRRRSATAYRLKPSAATI